MAEDDVTSIGRDGHGQAELLAGVLRAATEFSIIATDADGTITVFNEGAERMLGYGADEVVGRMTPELIHDPREVAARAAELGLNPSFEVFVALVRNGEAETREWTYVCKDGSRIPVSVTVTAIRDAAGEVTGFVGIARDITESRRVQTELRTAEELFRRTFEGSAIGVALVAPDGRWLEVNPALCDLLGYTAAELLAGSFQEITHPDDLQTDLELVADVLAGRLEGYEMEKRYLRKDGSAIWGLLTVSLVRAEDGTPLHFVSQVQDITARKQAEAALAHQATHDDLTGLWNRRRMDEELLVSPPTRGDTAATPPCCSSTSTGSRRSTTASATRRATPSSTPSAPRSAARCARATPAPGSAETSSPCCCHTATRSVRVSRPKADRRRNLRAARGPEPG